MTDTATTQPSARDAQRQAAAGLLAQGRKVCPGAPKYDLPAHVAPVADFSKSKTHSDGLSRVCQPCWTKYTAALRAAKPAVDKPAKAPRATKPVPVAPDHLPEDKAEVATPEGQQALADGFEAGKAARKAFEREAARVRMAKNRAAKKAAAAATS